MIITTTASAYIISHAEAINYANCKLNPALFEINKPFISNVHKSLSQKAKELEVIYMSEIVPHFQDKKTSAEQKENSKAVTLATELFRQSESPYEKFNGANATNSVVISEFRGSSYVFPSRCVFYNCDLLNDEVAELGGGGKYDLLVLDPPWRNKFIKRRKGNSSGYDTSSNDDIGAKLKPLIASLLVPDDAIVAIWATNSKTDLILNKFLPLWGLHHVVTFYWLKVTTSGGLTVPFTKPDGKQPFETIILATNASKMTVCAQKLLVSTPSAINSHKPPLTEVLEHYFDRTFNSKAELFARYLQSDYTSYGNQVLKLNNRLLFNFI